jgi:hypothetical protein
MCSSVCVQGEREVIGAQGEVDADARDEERVGAGETATDAVDRLYEVDVGAAGEEGAIGGLGGGENAGEEEARLANILRDADDLQASNFFLFRNDLWRILMGTKRRTPSYQFSFQNPGVPQGHVLVPPESIHAGTWKSFENQKSIALLMPACNAGSWDKASAPDKLPLHAADMAAGAGRGD